MPPRLEPEPSILVPLGRRVRELRLELGCSMRELEILGGVNRGQLSMIENGRSNITIGTLHTLAKALRVRPEDLLRTPEEDPHWQEVVAIVEALRLPTARRRPPRLEAVFPSAPKFKRR